MLGQVSPLWAVMAIESLRRTTTVLALLPAIAMGVVVLAYIGIPASPTTRRHRGATFPLPSDLAEWGLCRRVICVGRVRPAGAAALATTLRREQARRAIGEHAVKWMSRPQVAGYLGKRRLLASSGDAGR